MSPTDIALEIALETADDPDVREYIRRAMQARVTVDTCDGASDQEVREAIEEQEQQATLVARGDH